MLDEEMDLMRHEYEMKLAATQMRLQESMVTLEEALKQQHGFPQEAASSKEKVGPPRAVLYPQLEINQVKKTRTCACQAPVCYTWWNQHPRFQPLAERNHGFFNEGRV